MVLIIPGDDANRTHNYMQKGLEERMKPENVTYYPWGLHTRYGEWVGVPLFESQLDHKFLDGQESDNWHSLIQSKNIYVMPTMCLALCK